MPLTEDVVRILVCGGRDYSDYEAVSRAINALLPAAVEDDMGTWLPPPDTVIIHGGATGADSLADQWAVVHWVKIEEYKADWTDFSEPCVWKTNSRGYKYNALAGFKRNQRMIDEGKPDVVLAFPGGRGTRDMIKRANEAGIPVILGGLYDEEKEPRSIQPEKPQTEGNSQQKENS